MNNFYREKLVFIAIFVTCFLTKDVLTDKHGLLKGIKKELFPVITLPVESVSKTAGISVESVIVVILLIVLAVMLFGPFSLLFLIPLLLLLTATSLSLSGVKRSGRALLNKRHDRDGGDLSSGELYTDKLITGLLLAKIDGYINDFTKSMTDDRSYGSP